MFLRNGYQTSSNAFSSTYHVLSLITDIVNQFHGFQNAEPSLQIELNDSQTSALQAFVKMNISEVHHKV